MRVQWSLRARSELRAQRLYIAREQPAAALRLARRVVAAVDRLGAYPYLGRAATWTARRGLRELPVARTPFVVVYAVDEEHDLVVVLSVIHGAQRRRDFE
ncbi:MAG: type II toxin-antitoxin system RelE/ParE family toxin [Chloroflexota bacterium]